MDDTVRYDVNFKYVDRGSPVALKALLVLNSKPGAHFISHQRRYIKVFYC